MAIPGAAFSLLLAHLLCLQLFILDGNHRLLVVGINKFNRYDFPPGFIFGSGTSAYQVEGAAFEDGRKASIFDTFAHSGKVIGNGDVAADQYHRYKEDVQVMVETGLDAYRFSISWSRLLPDGRGAVNPKGLEYYNNLINELISNGIQPHVTLMHMDVPQSLEDEYEGFLNRKIIKDFTAYADVCFREFGDRVRYWSTINEANIFLLGGYCIGDSPPQRCSHCARGNSSTEPYIAAHNVSLAHASVARLYRKNYQARQQGSVGFSLYTFHFIPYSSTKEDEAAAQRSNDFFFGWLMHPLMHGDYPMIMKTKVRNRLPTFTKKESELVKGSSDFIGMNYYTVILTQDSSGSAITEKSYITDMEAIWNSINHSAPMGKNPYPNLPWALQRVLELFKQQYDNPVIYIHENGQLSEPNMSVDDRPRVNFSKSFVEKDQIQRGTLLGHSWTCSSCYMAMNVVLAYTTSISVIRI